MSHSNRYNQVHTIKSTGRLPVANLPICGKVAPGTTGDVAPTSATKAGTRPSLQRAVFI